MFVKNVSLREVTCKDANGLPGEVYSFEEIYNSYPRSNLDKYVNWVAWQNCKKNVDYLIKNISTEENQLQLLRNMDKVQQLNYLTLVIYSLANSLKVKDTAANRIIFDLLEKISQKYSQRRFSYTTLTQRNDLKAAFAQLFQKDIPAELAEKIKTTMLIFEFPSGAYYCTVGGLFDSQNVLVDKEVNPKNILNRLRKKASVAQEDKLDFRKVLNFSYFPQKKHVYGIVWEAFQKKIPSLIGNLQLKNYRRWFQSTMEGIDNIELYNLALELLADRLKKESVKEVEGIILDLIIKMVRQVEGIRFVNPSPAQEQRLKETLSVVFKNIYLLPDKEFHRNNGIRQEIQNVLEATGGKIHFERTAYFPYATTTLEDFSYREGIDWVEKYLEELFGKYSREAQPAVVQTVN